MRAPRCDNDERFTADRDQRRRRERPRQGMRDLRRRIALPSVCESPDADLRLLGRKRYIVTGRKHGQEAA